MRSSLSYWCCEIQAYKQSRGWNVRRQGERPKEADSTGEQEEFPQNSWFSYCIGQKLQDLFTAIIGNTKQNRKCKKKKLSLFLI